MRPNCPPGLGSQVPDRETIDQQPACASNTIWYGMADCTSRDAAVQIGVSAAADVLPALLAGVAAAAIVAAASAGSAAPAALAAVSELSAACAPACSPL